MKAPYLRIVKVPIKQCEGVFRDRWFLELVEGNRIHDCGNYASEDEALEAKRNWPQRKLQPDEE